MRRTLSLCAAVLLLSSCSAGSVEASGDVAMSVSDAVWWTVSGTGDPGEDGSVMVLLSSSSDLCHALTVSSFLDDQELFALQAFSGTSGAAVKKGSYSAAAAGPRAAGQRYAAPAGCHPPTAKEAVATGTLTLDDTPANGSSLSGSFKGTMAGGIAVTVGFSASSCPAAANAMTGLATGLKFKSCG